MDEFFQAGPVLQNQYTTDSLLRSHLQRVLPKEELASIEPDLERFGGRVVGDVAELSADAQANEPTLTSYDPWGRRIDRINMCPSWKKLEGIAAQEGLVAIGYERPLGWRSRIYQFAKLYLFHPSSAVVTCPLAMTDGAARLIEVHGDAVLRDGPFRRLTSRDSEQFWTSGQWMTERTGGSDVGQSRTIARPVSGKPGFYRLFGDKWFTSATTSQMALTLARIEEPGGAVVSGSRGLSLFWLEVHQSDGSRNDIVVRRLKEKLGTRAMPTAELTLDGTLARMVGEPGRGVRNIATMMNVTRIYNASCAASMLRRGTALISDYARRRVSFGRTLAEQPLHRQTAAELSVEAAGAFQLVFHLAGLLGKEECNLASPEELAVLRLLIPLSKLYTARQCVAGMSEVLESFGGAGYIEDTGLPRLLRDSQVLSIWEGTTNILSLDVLRAIESVGSLEPLFTDCARRVGAVRSAELADSVRRTMEAAGVTQQFALAAMQKGEDYLQSAARRFAFSLTRIYTAGLLLEAGEWGLARGDKRAAAIARRWCRQDLAPLPVGDDGEWIDSGLIAFEPETGR